MFETAGPARAAIVRASGGSEGNSRAGWPKTTVPDRCRPLRSDRIQVLQPLAGRGAALGRLDQREGLHLAIDLEGQHTATDHRGCHADITGGAVGQPDVNPLEVRLESAATHAG